MKRSPRRISGTGISIYIVITVLLRGYDLHAAPISPDSIPYYFFAETPVVKLDKWEELKTGWTFVPGLPWALLGLPVSGEVSIVRKFDIPEPLDDGRHLCIEISSAVSNLDVRFDGTILHRGDGKIPARFICNIPDSLVNPGPHIIALKMTQTGHLPGLLPTAPLLGYQEEISALDFRDNAASFLLAGIFLAMGLIQFALLAGKGSRPPYVLFGLYCLACSADLVLRQVASSPIVAGGSYQIFALINDVPWLLMTAILPVFCMYEFTLPRRGLVAAASVAISFAVVATARCCALGILPMSWIVSTAATSQIYAWISVFFALVATAWAAGLKRRGSITALAGFAAFFVGVMLSGIGGFEYGWSLGLCILNAFLVLSLSRQMSHRAAQYRESELRRLRVEMDLMKQHLKPHFLLNSLNSIAAWIEEDPPVAARLVTAFGRELRMVIDASSQPLVTMERELDLCRTHLEVMSMRHGKSYSLSVNNRYGDFMIPPLILHTIVENGLTHGFREKPEGIFCVSCEKTPRWFSIILSNNGSSDSHKSSSGGTGLRYVKARLEEVFPSKWELTSGPVADGWQTEIKLIGVDR